MTTPEDVAKLAALARIEVAPERLPAFAAEFENILAYVGKLENLSVGVQEPLLPYENVMRKDGEPHEKGIWTKELTEQFPKRDGDHLAVRQIISHD